MWSMNTSLSVARSTLAAAVGISGGPFPEHGPVHRGELVLDRGASLPGGTQLLQPGRRADVLVRRATQTGSGIRTLCVKVPDAYGQRRDQDFLLASSADGVPLHHATLPVDAHDEWLYSSLWLYLAGARPLLFGARASAPGAGELDFMISDVIGRFRRIGALTLAAEPVDATETRFAARNSGGGLRPLPPALFYRS